MKKNKDRQGRTKADRFFTDRTTPREAFWENYEKVSTNFQQDEDVHVLTYYGIGGIGKSRLLKELQIEMQQELSNPLYVYYDFNDSNDMRSTLQSLKGLLEQKYHFKFNLYDLAEYVYAQKSGNNVKREEIQSLVQKSPILDMLLSGAEMIPLVGIIPGLIRLGDMGIQWVRNLVESYKFEINELVDMSKAELYQNLPYYFAKDLSENMQKQDSPLVIFLDTYEVLVNEMNMVGEPYSKDLWLRGEDGLICNADGVLWVIAGRERIKWDVLDTDWTDSLEQHMLDELSPEDIILFLETSGMKPRSLCEGMVKLTGGTPIYLDLCMDQYEELIRHKIEPTQDKFGHNTETLVERFMRYMDGSIKDIVYILTCLERWTDDFIMDIGPRIISSFSYSNYEKVKEFSFISQSDDGTYELHKTVRKVLFKYCKEWIWKKTFKEALEAYWKLYENSRVWEYDGMIPTMCSYCCHLYRGAELIEAYMERTANMVKRAGVRGNTGVVSAVGEVFYEWSKQDEAAYALAKLEESSLAGYTGDYEKALCCTDECLQELSKILDENSKIVLMILRQKYQLYLDSYQPKEAMTLAKEVCDRLISQYGYEEIVTRVCVMDYAEELARNGHLEEAVAMLTEAYEAVKDLPQVEWAGKTNLQMAIAACYHFNEKSTEALEIREQIYENTVSFCGVSDSNTIVVGKELACSYREVGRYEDAERLVNQLKKNCNPEKMSWVLIADLEKVNASILSCNLKYEEALKAYNMVYEAYKEHYGVGHFMTVNRGIDIANTLIDQGKDDLGIARYEQELENLRENYGADHVDTISKYDDYAYMLMSMQRYEEALSMMKRLLDWNRERYSEESSQVISSYVQFSEIYQEMADYENAVFYAKKAAELTAHNDNLIWDRIRALEQLASIEKDWGYSEENTAYLRQVWELARDWYGENHILTIEKEINYRAGLSDIGDIEGAISGLQICYDKMEKLLGKGHVELLRIKKLIAWSYYDAENYQKSLDMCVAIEQEYLQQLFEGAQEVISIRRSIIDSLAGLGLYDEAIEKSVELFSVMKSNRKENWHAQRNLAELYKYKGDYDKADAAYIRTYEMLADKLGETHIETVTIWACRGDILLLKGKYEEALSYYDKVISAFMENGWEVVEELDKALISAAICYTVLKQYKKAMDTYALVDCFKEGVTEDQKLIVFIRKILAVNLYDVAWTFFETFRDKIAISEGAQVYVYKIFVNYCLSEGKLIEAKELLLKILEFEQEKKTSNSIWAMRYLIQIVAVNHDSEETLKWIERYLEYSREKFEAAAPELLYSLVDSAWACQYTGNNAYGQKLLDEVEESYEFSDEDVEDEIYYRRIKVKYLVDDKLFEEAHQEMELVLELEKLYGKSDLIMEINNSRAYLAYGEGKTEEAKKYLEEAIHRTQYTCNKASSYARETYEFMKKLQALETV